jgi:hypothetical protein
VKATSSPGLAQWPFVGVAVLLVALIFLTPSLLSQPGHPSAGSPASQAELIVDKATSAGPVNVYLRALGIVRWTNLSVGVLAGNLAWPPPPSGSVNWTWRNWTNASALVSLSLVVAHATFALNVTAVYVDPSGAVVAYGGVYEVHATNSDLAIAPVSPPGSMVGPAPLASLPLALLLASIPPPRGAGP